MHLPIAGTSLAGHLPTPGLVDGAFEITTGGSIPSGCDAVLVAERARLSADRRELIIDRPVPPGANIRCQGEDVIAGETILSAGTKIDAAALGALACYGVTTVDVRRQPHIAVLTTGDELATLGNGDLGSVGVIDSNGPMVAAQACEAGAQVWLAPAVDKASAIATAIDRTIAERRPDIIVSTGGVSVGQRDRVPEALARLGATVWFHGVSMRPGKPVLFATLPDGTLFFGLPGNPVAAFLGFRFFVTTALRVMLGLPTEVGCPVAVRTERRPGVTLVLKANSEIVDGQITAEPTAGQQSHVMRPLLGANAWLIVRDNGPHAVLFPMTSSFERRMFR